MRTTLAIITAAALFAAGCGSSNNTLPSQKELDATCQTLHDSARIWTENFLRPMGSSLSDPQSQQLLASTFQERLATYNSHLFKTGKRYSITCP